MSVFWLKVDKTLRHHFKNTIVKLRGAWWDKTRVKAERPIFIVSGSRSGTQMLYKTLCESKEIGSLNREIYPIWDGLHKPADKNWDTHALGAGDASQYDRDVITRYFYSYTGKNRFMDKNNQHGLAVPYLHALFPDATFIYLKRSPGDTLNSMIQGWGMPERNATWALDLPDRVAVDQGRYTQWCFFVADGWREYLNANVEDVCAFQYRSIHSAILEAKKNIPSSQWIEIFYEDIVNDPVNNIADLFGRLGLTFDDRVKNHTSMLLDKPYDAFFEIRLDKWRSHQHKERIERVLPQVKEVASLMGYQI